MRDFERVGELRVLRRDGIGSRSKLMVEAAINGMKIGLEFVSIGAG